MPKPSNMHAARAGRFFVAAELNRRGAGRVELTPDIADSDVRAERPDGRTLEIVVRSRRTGDWQVRASAGSARAEDPDEARYWIFVDLGSELGSPSYFVVPEWWVQNDINEAHQAYLERHGGQRAKTPNSDHHRIPISRIESWRDNWAAILPG
jgi:hypothetical protein